MTTCICKIIRIFKAYTGMCNTQIIWIFKEYMCNGQTIWIFKEYMWNRQQVTVKDYTVPLKHRFDIGNHSNGFSSHHNISQLWTCVAVLHWPHFNCHIMGTDCLHVCRWIICNYMYIQCSTVVPLW